MFDFLYCAKRLLSKFCTHCSNLEECIRGLTLFERDIVYLEEQNSLFEAHGAVQFAWVDLVGSMYMGFLCCGILSTRSGADFVLRDGKINKSCLFGKVRGS